MHEILKINCLSVWCESAGTCS